MLDTYYKKILGYSADDDEREILRAWRKNVSIVCKPCWELKYCPYGPLVEDFPVYPVTKSEMAGECDDEDFINSLPDQMPPKIIEECYCTEFGHMCPVFFVKEPFTETETGRRTTRYIPRNIMLKVARRDDYHCQICNEHIRDDEIEFDHIIPFSKGGPTEVHNLRLLCRKCNRDKNNTVDLS
jgi:hypothetical protein